jgi:hypothetical protein
VPAQAVEAELARPVLPGLVAPAWEGRTLGSILVSVLRAFGARADGLLPPLRDLPPEVFEGVERVVLLTLDGWGWRQLHDHLQGGWAQLAARGALTPLTTVCPSTTTASFATLNTGVAPAQHGLVGYLLWLQEFGCIANMVSFAPAVGGRGLDGQMLPETFFDTPTAAQLLKPAGAWHLNVTRREFLGSALTRMLYQGSDAVGTSTLGELLVELRRGLQAMKGSAGLLQGYWPSLDTVAHARGPRSEHHAAEIALLGDAIERELASKVDDPTALLLITADHGLTTVPPAHMLRVRDHPELADALLLPPWGDSRWGFLQPRADRAADVRRLLEERWGKEGLVLDIAQVEQLKLLGPGPWSARTRRRVADLVALPPPNRGIAWPFQHDLPGRPPKEELIGRHGGATAEEMLVPLLAVRLG